MIINSKYIQLIKILIVHCSLFIPNCLCAGPPFNTDDPQPVDYRHWEFYVSSINTFSNNSAQGTLPHIEINYGVIPNVQLHLIIPLNYNYIQHSEFNIQHSFRFGYGYTELGIKYRFIQENDNTPQIGFFPIAEVPTSRSNQFNNGKPQIYLPIWLQKSWGKLTSYGGAGYWINPGTGNKNWFFAGWELQYDFTKTLTFGGELTFHTSPNDNEQRTTNNNSFGFNLGGFINFSQKFHFIFSGGHSFSGPKTVMAYGGLLWTI